MNGRRRMVEGAPLSPIRRARLSEENATELWIIERHGSRGFQSRAADPKEVAAVPAHEESFRRRKLICAMLAICAVALLAILTGCSSEPSKPQEPAKPENKGPELLTARSAFQKVYIAARGWNQDARPYRIASHATSDGNGHDGKWAVWSGSFASPAARAVKTYTWSGSSADGAPSKGINPGTEDSYNPSNANTQVWDMAFLKIDSDQAFTEAQKHGGDKITGSPVTYLLEWEAGENHLLWHVIYGASRSDAKLVVDVDATTAEFNRKEK